MNSTHYLGIGIQTSNKNLYHIGFLVRNSLKDNFKFIHYFEKKIQESPVVMLEQFFPNFSKEKQKEIIQIIVKIQENNKEEIPFNFEKNYKNIFVAFKFNKESEGLNCSTFILSILSLANINLLNSFVPNSDKDISWIIKELGYFTNDMYRYPAKNVIKKLKEYK